MIFNLNRLNKDFKITEDVPVELIIFLMKTTGKIIDKERALTKIEKVTNHLESFETPLEIKENYSQEELSLISLYVSDSEKPWKVNTLISSFKDLMEFYNNFQFPDIRDITFGSRNNTYPNSYDICMTYILCKKLNIRTNREDTLDSMKAKLLHLETLKEASFIKLKNNLNSLNSLELYNISNTIHDKKQEYIFSSSSDLEELSKKININYIIKNSILNNEEAIVYAAKFFNYDISESSCPVSILKSITDKKNDEVIFEIEDDFVKRFKINPKLYRLDKFMRKNIKFLYTSKSSSNLKNYENLEDHEEIEKRYGEDNFYDGIVSFDTERSEETEKIISFGIFDKKQIEIIKVEDLIQNFKENLTFGKYEKNIEKLVNICREYKDQDYISLHKIVRYIQKYCCITDQSVKKLKEISEKNKNIIKEIFCKLLEISDLLKNKESIDDLDNISIMNSILNLNTYISKITDSELKTTLEKIPLINYKEDNFCKPLENYYSNLIEDLQNTKNLKDKSKDYLINKRKYYAFTSYYYMYIFYKETLFDLEKY